jgi:hypothetical protein
VKPGTDVPNASPIIASIGAVMAGLVSAIHVVQLEIWKRFATILQWRSNKS